MMTLLEEIPFPIVSAKRVDRRNSIRARSCRACSLQNKAIKVVRKLRPAMQYTTKLMLEFNTKQKVLKQVKM